MDFFVIMALVATLGTWFVTALGADTVVFFSSPNPKAMNIMLGFAAGCYVGIILLRPSVCFIASHRRSF